MPEYRRPGLTGGTCFFTVNLVDRRSDLLVANIGPLRASIARVRHLVPSHVDAWVVLPDHYAGQQRDAVHPPADVRSPDI